MQSNPSLEELQAMEIQVWAGVAFLLRTGQVPPTPAAGASAGASLVCLESYDDAVHQIGV